MATHLDDEEELERIKTWWKENWVALVGGLVIGFAAIGGWQGYQKWRNGRAEAASELYEELRKALDERRSTDARSLGDQLAADYAGTPYAAVGALRLAQDAVRTDQLDEAAQRLGWVVAHADDDGMVQMARLRQARVLYARSDYDGALALLQQGDAGSFASLYDELRGDIELAKGAPAAARTAYEKALPAADERLRPLIQKKLDDLAVASAS